MAGNSRRQEKIARRKKRQQQKQQRQARPRTDAAPVVKTTPEFPGAIDQSTAHPDRLKYSLAMFATQRPPGEEKVRQLEAGLKRGLISHFPDLHSWAIEEFTYHGLPGDDWRPIEAFVQQAGEQLTEAGRAQVRLWKDARIGMFEVGPVQGGTMELHEWDPIEDALIGQPFRAISLNLSGVDQYRQSEGNMLLTYVAPWAPDEDLYCCMGYGSVWPREIVGLTADYLALQKPQLVSTPLPWKIDSAAAKRYQAEWKDRDWQGWLQEHLKFPFTAFVGLPPDFEPLVYEVDRLAPATAEKARDLGIYFPVELEDGIYMAGATLVMPVDVASSNRMVLAEYHAFREWAGAPRGTRGLPLHIELE